MAHSLLIPTMEISGISAGQAQSQQSSSLWGADGFGFDDILDAVNPFQHLPIISNIYQGLTGDTMGSFASVVGSTLFGGPIAGGVALANEVVKSDTGKTITQHAVDTVTGGNSSASQHALVAEKYQDTEQKTSPQRSTTHDWIYSGTHMA